jgi:hypothetical protein
MHIESCWLDITPRADLASLSVYPCLLLAPSPMGHFLSSLLSRNDVYTLNEHVSIEEYHPQTGIHSCWLDISARTDVDRLLTIALPPPWSLAYGLLSIESVE